MAMNSAFISIQIAGAEQNDRIRYSAACTGLRSVMTFSAAPTSSSEKA